MKGSNAQGIQRGQELEHVYKPLVCILPELFQDYFSHCCQANDLP